jgi:prolipoprotein diacylglyceryltransferase
MTHGAGAAEVQGVRQGQEQAQGFAIHGSLVVAIIAMLCFKYIILRNAADSLEWLACPGRLPECLPVTDFRYLKEPEL